MRILFFGGSGFLGSRYLQLFSKKHNIIVVCRSSEFPYFSKKVSEEIRFIKCDITDKESLNKLLLSGFDLVVHAAAKINISNESKGFQELIQTNVLGTVNILEAVVNAKIKKILFCSSMTVYSPETAIPALENSSLSPVHFYGISKMWAEDVIRMYAEKKRIKALIIRYPGLYGLPKRSGYIYSIAYKMLRDQPVEVNTQGLKFWESMHIDDALVITEKLLNVWEWDKDYETMNCGYGGEVDRIKTAYRIKEMLNSKSHINTIEPLDYKRFYLSNSKIKSLLNSDFDYDFEKGLGKFLNELKHRKEQD
jgi:UDP-glucose 4-epimerase